MVLSVAYTSRSLYFIFIIADGSVLIISKFQS